ncbi:MAG: DnaA/Hda family protein [Rubripirellula sp.]
MSAPHGCNDDMAVVDSFKEALKQRIGAERYQMWFAHGVQFAIDSESSEGDSIHHGTIIVSVRGQFAMERLQKNFLQELRGAAMQACGSPMDIRITLDEHKAEQIELPLADPDSEAPSKPSPPRRTVAKKRSDSRPRRRNAQSLQSLVSGGAGRHRQTAKPVVQTQQLELPIAASQQSNVPSSSEPAETSKPTGPVTPRSQMTASSFVVGSSNQLANTALSMVCQNPAVASPLFVSGPTGTGKTHILTAIAQQFRTRHRMRRVIHLSAEQFTNDFISSVGNSGITAFRRRYREVDALLIDDVQFLGAKQATLREMLYTVETLLAAGRPLVFSGLQSPTDISGLSRELAGRLAAGLVCPIQPLDPSTRKALLTRWIEAKCPFELPESMVDQLVPILSGDGRVISGVVNLINTLQRMNGRVPSMDELRLFGGELLRASKPVATLAVIESAVCEAFHLPTDTLRAKSQTRAVTEPRMLAMYLSRQLTSSAYAEIARHFGGKSHSTAITAEKNVKAWLDKGKSIGRGHASMSAQEAIARIESLLRTG